MLVTGFSLHPNLYLYRDRPCYAASQSCKSHRLSRTRSLPASEGSIPHSLNATRSVSEPNPSCTAGSSSTIPFWIPMPHPDDVEAMESASAQRRMEDGQVMTLDEGEFLTWGGLISHILAPASAAVAFQSRPLVSDFTRLRTHDERTLPDLSGYRHAMRNSLDPCTPRTIGQIKHHLSSISSLLGPFLAPQEELESLQGEVEMWKKRWEQSQMEITSLRLPLEVRRGMDGVANKAMDFGVVLIDGNSLIVSLSPPRTAAY